MKVVFLGNIGSEIIDIIRSAEDEVFVTSQIVNTNTLNEYGAEFIVSYGYPHIVTPEVIEHVHGKIINLHISYLPWNRGSDPDFWSLVDDTPKGVTIHYMDGTLDTGDIIAQQEVAMVVDETLAEYCSRLHKAVFALFAEHWDRIKAGAKGTAQVGEGSYHRSVDKAEFLHLLPNGTDTLISTILNGKHMY